MKKPISTADPIWKAWLAGGALAGKHFRPHGRVTVEPGFMLNSANTAGGYPWTPVKWYQRQDNTQLEVEIPGVRQIHTSYSLDSAAATAKITVSNTGPYRFGQGDPTSTDFGEVGLLTPDRGTQTNRWGFTTNGWTGILGREALIRCVDTETEILTKKGWLRWDEVVEGDETLGINPETGVAEWQVIEEVFRKEHSGPMTCMRNRVHDSLTTANHRWLTKTPAGRWSWKTTETLTRSSSIPLSAPVELPTTPIYNDDLVELCAWYFTEGSHEHRQRSLDWGIKISQSSSANPENVERIRLLSKRLYGSPGLLPRGPSVAQERIDAVLRLHAEGVGQREIARKLGENRNSVHRWVTGIRRTDRSALWCQKWPRPDHCEFHFTQVVGREVTRLVAGPDKVPTPEFLCALTQEQLDLFIEVCILGDGSRDCNQTVFIQCNEARMSAFEMACALAGQPTHRKTATCATLLRRKAFWAGNSSQEAIQYDGVIWCPRVKHGNWLARSRNSIYYTGNTYQGYGGHGLSIADAVAQGYLVLTGVWMVDNPDLSADDSTLTLNCRSMAKLFLDQEVFPGLVPANLYPISFFAADQDLGNYDPIEIYGQVTGTFPVTTGTQPSGTGIYVMGIETNTTGDGYWLLGSDGAVFSYGNTHNFGAPIGLLIQNDFTIGIARTSTANGYWVATNKGRVYSFGNATYEHAFGDTGGPTPGEPPHPVVAIERMSPSGNGGYILVTSVGEVYAYGDAVFHGGTPTLVSGDSIVAAAVRPQNDGYWLISAKGDVYSYGAAAFYGVVGAASSHPITGAVSSNTGLGYYIVASDGGVFTYGDATFYGSIPGTPVNETVPNVRTLAGSKVISISPTAVFQSTDVGESISGTGIPAGTTVAAFTDSSHAHLSALATATANEAVTITRPVTVSINTVAGNQIISAPTPTFQATDLHLGIAATGIPANTTIVEVINPTQAKISNAATATTGAPEAATIARTVVIEGVQVSAASVAIVLNQGTFLPGYVGNPISGDNLAAGTMITSVDSTTQVHISQAATGTTNPDADVIVTIQSFLGLGVPLNDPVTDIAVASNSLGYWLGAGDGGVFTYSALQRVQSGVPIYWVRFYGSLPGAFAYFLPGNYCTDEQTEILTQRGWLTVDDLIIGDLAWSLDPVTMQGLWRPVTDVYENHYDGPMVSIETERHSSLTTPNHKWFIDDRERGKEWRSSERLTTGNRIPVSAEPADQVPVYKDEFVELVAWFFTEGSYGGREDRWPSATFSQSERVNPANVESIRACLRNLYGAPGPITNRGRWKPEMDERNQRIVTLLASGMSQKQVGVIVGLRQPRISAIARGPRRNVPAALWNESAPRPNGVIVWSLAAEVRDELMRVVSHPHKAICPKFLAALSVRQLDIFIRVSLLGDGHRRSSNLLFTQSGPGAKGRSDSFAMACVLAGQHPNLNAYDGTFSVSLIRKVGSGMPESDLPAPSRWTHVRNKTIVPFRGRIWCPTIEGTHLWLARRDGKVYFTGNSDLSEIVIAFALWSGFYLYDGGKTYNVYGNLESTGTHSTEILDASLFDKKSVADAIKVITDIVSFVQYVGDEGEFHWHNPNWWQSGNVLPDGTRVTDIPVIDERKQLTKYTRSLPDTDLRSQVIVSSEDPYPDTGGGPIPGTITSTATPRNAAELRGLVKPAMLINEAYTDPAEQAAMAELISMQIYFRSDAGSLTMVACPHIQIDDQIQILERKTFELNYHYVRGIDTTMDLKTGEYTSQVTTTLLQPGSTALPWVVTKPGIAPSGITAARFTA